MRQKRVLFIAPSAYPLGGVAVWLNYLLPRLAELGWKVRLGLVAGRHHDVATYLRAYPGLLAFAFPIPNPSGSREGRIRALADALRCERPYVVVSVNIVDVYAAVRRVRREGQALRGVMALHGIAADLLADLQREAALGLDAVIATNRLACRLCEVQAGMPAERVFYAPYGVDAGTIGALPRHPRTVTLRIAWVGRLEQPQKRAHDLPLILAELDELLGSSSMRQVALSPDPSPVDGRGEQFASPFPQVGEGHSVSPLPSGERGRGEGAPASGRGGQFVSPLPSGERGRGEGAVPYHLRIVGDGPERAAIEKALQPWIQAGRVEFTGALPASALPEQVYAQADVLLITSSWETGPIVAWEAMAAGVPVVSSRYVGSGLERALVDAETALLFPVGDAKAAALALVRLAQDTGLAARLADSGRQLVHQRYTHAASSTAWDAALMGVLDLPVLPLPDSESTYPPNGRLDRWFGISLGENVRRALRIGFRHVEPGGEWPHTLAAGANDMALLSGAQSLDIPTS